MPPRSTNKDTEPGTDVVKPDEVLPPAANGETGTVAPLVVDQATLERYLSGAETMVQPTDPEEVVRGIVAKILAADTLDAVLNRQAVTGLKDLVGKPLEIRDVRWMQSEYADGVPFYALIDCVNLLTGEVLVASCGGMQVLAQLFVMKTREWLPVKVAVGTTPKPTQAGYYPIFLEPIPDHLRASADPEPQF